MARSLLHLNSLTFVKLMALSTSGYLSTIRIKRASGANGTNLYAVYEEMGYPYSSDLQIFFLHTERLCKLRQMSHNVSC